MSSLQNIKFNIIKRKWVNNKARQGSLHKYLIIKKKHLTIPNIIIITDST